MAHKKISQQDDTKIINPNPIGLFWGLESIVQKLQFFCDGRAIIDL